MLNVIFMHFQSLVCQKEPTSKGKATKNPSSLNVKVLTLAGTCVPVRDMRRTLPSTVRGEMLDSTLRMLEGKELGKVVVLPNQKKVFLVQ